MADDAKDGNDRLTAPPDTRDGSTREPLHLKFKKRSISAYKFGAAWATALSQRKNLHQIFGHKAFPQ
ncbi:MAG: hypothetical protein NWQ69_02950, partial [Paracoccaceae bacterium]|nr:hypothetical protein [Paracoccaceae bacterium]